MTLVQIKEAVDKGQTVHWVTTAYKVIKDYSGRYLVVYQPNGYCNGLTTQGGTLNGNETEFFTA
jgi:hypothetical protein